MKQGEPFNVLRDRNSWSNAPRAETVALQLLSALSITATPTAVAIATAAVSLAISVATSAIISALTPPPPSPKQSLLVNSRNATGPQEFVYGTVRKGGTITYLDSSSNGKVLYQVITLAGHEVEDIEAIYLNDELAVLSEDGYDNGDRTGPGWVTSPRRWSEDDDSTKHEVRIFYHKGNQTSVSTPFANSSTFGIDDFFAQDSGMTNPGSNFVGKGVACIFVRYTFEADVFDEGLPVVTVKMKGKKVYDPRTQTTAFSNNAALCVRDFLTSSYGLNDPEVDDTVFSAAANTCDESVALVGGGAEKRYTIDGVISGDQTYGDVLQQMVSACAGTLFWGAGKWKLQVGEYNAPTKTLTLDDLRSSISLQTRVNLRDQFNRVQGTFIDANQRYIAADYPPYPNQADYPSSAFLAQDGGVEQVLNLDLPFTTSGATAQRLAKMTLLRGREQMFFSAEFGLNAFDVEVGDIIALDMDRYGWTAKEFEVVGWRFGADQDAGDLRITLSLRETSEAAFSWSAEESEIIGNDTTLFPYNTNVNILNLSVSGGGKTQGDGTFINSAILSWDAVDNATLVSYEVQWKPVADSSYSATTTTETSIETSPLIDGVEYIFRVRTKLSMGRFGPYSTINFTGGGDETAPGPVTGLSASGAFQVITITYTPPTDSDWNYVNAYESLDSSFANASVIGTSASDIFYRLNLPNDTTRYYWVETVDFSGNTGPVVGPVSATTLLIEENDFSQALQDTLDQAGLEAVNALPASGTTDGQVVLLLTDFTLYRWDEASSSWSTDLYTGIKEGTVVTDSIAVDAITNELIANNAVQAENIANLAVTADKIASSAVTVTKIANAAVEAGKIAAGAVTESKIADLAISADKIASNAVTSVKIATSAVEAGKIATGAVTGIKIATSAITETKIASNAITTPKIAAGAVTADEIAAGSITTGKIAAGAVTAAEIAAGTITANEIATNTITSTNIAAGAVTAAEILAGTITANEIATNTITSAQIAAGAVTASEIAAGTITSNEIATDTITASNIAAGAITASEIATGAITSTKIAADAITASKIASNTITANEIAADAITANELAANSVLATKISAGAVTSDKVAANAITSNSIVAGAIVGSKIAAGAVTSDKISVNELTAVAAQIGTFQSAATGARLKISDDVIEVYDSSNNIRVKLGNLS